MALDQVCELRRVLLVHRDRTSRGDTNETVRRSARMMLLRAIEPPPDHRWLSCAVVDLLGELMRPSAGLVRRPLTMAATRLAFSEV